jgi:predicted MFS family arabinose efflux permease
MTPRVQTQWPLAFVLIVGGIIAAFQIGKAAIAVPLLRDDLGLSLTGASWIVGAFGTLGAAAGLPAGVAVSRLGARPAAIVGMFAMAMGGALGAVTTSFAALFAARMFEGCGFLALVIATPTLLRQISTDKDRDVVFTLWAAYIATGTAVMMLAAPLLTQHGWQGLWWANAALTGAYGVLLWAILPRDLKMNGTTQRSLRKDAMRTLRAPGPVLLALAFITYTIQYYAITALLPTLFVERMQFSVEQASVLSALIVFANALGNMAAGLLLRWAIPLWALMAAAFVFVGITAFGIFAAAAPVIVVAVLAAASLAVSGLIPASLIAAAPRLSPEAFLLPVTLGLLNQASNIGILVGPAVLGGIVERFGWSGAPALFVAIALIGIAVALRIRRLLPAH